MIAFSTGRRNRATAAPWGQCPALDPLDEGPGRKHLCRIGRPTAGEHVDHAHVGDGEDHPEQHGTAMIGANSGIVTWNILRQKPAPSTATASVISVGMAMRPAMTMTAARGTILQVVIVITEVIAVPG